MKCSYCNSTERPEAVWASKQVGESICTLCASSLEIERHEEDEPLDVPHGFCARCGTEGEIRERDVFGERTQDHYECPECGDDWIE